MNNPSSSSSPATHNQPNVDEIGSIWSGSGAVRRRRSVVDPPPPAEEVLVCSGNSFFLQKPGHEMMTRPVYMFSYLYSTFGTVKHISLDIIKQSIISSIEMRIERSKVYKLPMLKTTVKVRRLGSDEVRWSVSVILNRDINKEERVMTRSCFSESISTMFRDFGIAFAENPEF